MINDENYTVTASGEELTLLADNEQGAAENPVVAGTAKPEKSTKSKSKRTSVGKLAALMEQQEKLTAARNSHMEKSNEIDRKLSDVEGRIKEIHLKEIERIRKERNFYYADIVALIGNIPDGAALEKLINDTKSQDEK